MPRPEIEFDAKLHAYTVNGEAVPSVTQIIEATVPKPFSAGAWWGYKMGVNSTHAYLIDAYANEVLVPFDVDEFYDEIKRKWPNPNTRLEDAGQRGRNVHDALHDFFMFDGIAIDDYDPAEHQRIQGVLDFIEKNGIEILAAEVVTASKMWKYAGTLDAYCRFTKGEYEGKTFRLDWKTSKNIYPNQHFPQVLAYEQAEVESGEDSADHLAVVHIPESGRVKMKVLDDTWTFDDFWVLLRFYAQQQKH